MTRWLIIALIAIAAFTGTEVAALTTPLRMAADSITAHLPD